MLCNVLYQLCLTVNIIIANISIHSDKCVIIVVIVKCEDASALQVRYISVRGFIFKLFYRGYDFTKGQ